MVVFLLYETSDLIGIYATHNTALREISERLTTHEQEARSLDTEPFIEILDYMIRPIRIQF